MIFLKQLELGPMENFIYLIGCSETKECAVVDPAWQVDTLLREAKNSGYRITKALISHHHFDHTNGLEELLSATDIPVYIHKKDASQLKGMKGNLVACEGADVVSIGHIKISCLHTPGHTRGSQCFLAENRLISGDTLFVNNCGRVDLPDSSPEDLFHSLSKLAALPEETLLYPGHNYGAQPSSSIAEEKTKNPYLVAARQNLSDFLRFVA